MASGALSSPAERRAAALDALATGAFDLLVIGGGITGAGIARDAAMRGLTVALIERDDFASGTSSRSSRLIHGGVRYLEHGHFHLVFESSRERRTLLRIAPHLVRPLPFTWPVYRDARIARWKLGAGLFLYDALALFRNIRNHQRFDAAQVERFEPMLRTADLLGGARYYDASTDDIALTIANVRAAADNGAVVANHVEALQLAIDEGRVTGAMVEDRRTGRTLAIRADIVINASGPWSDEIRRLAVPSATPTVRGTKGAHIAVPRARVGNIGAVTLLSPIDDRVMFVLPAGAHTIIGTTDTEYAGSAEEARATVADVSYLLRSTNAFFPAAHLTMDDVVSAWAGVRPLAAPGGRVSMRNPDAASREHAIDWTAPGLLTITGGKLTTYRAMAAEVVRTAMRKLAAAPKRGAPTDREPLPGGVMSSLDAELASARLVVHDDDVATHLVHAYGGEWSAVWALAQRDSAMAERVIEPLPYIAAEIRFAVEHAFAATLGDVLIRRLHVAFETRDHGRSVASYAASIIAPLLDWDHAEIERQLERYGIEVERMFGIDG